MTVREQLVSVCDDLLKCVAQGRSAKDLITKPEASELINRVLDIRNSISPVPKPQIANQP